MINFHGKNHNADDDDDDDDDDGGGGGNRVVKLIRSGMILNKVLMNWN